MYFILLDFNLTKILKKLLNILNKVIKIFNII